MTEQSLQDFSQLVIDSRKSQPPVIKDSTANELNQSEDGTNEAPPSYLSYEELEPISGNLDSEFKKACMQLQLSEDGGRWAKQFEACNVLRRVAKHHSSLMLQQGANQMGGIVSTLLRLCDSIRSSLSKIALLTITDMIYSLKRCLEPYLDGLVKLLLKKAALDTNSFITEEAEKALNALCCNCQDAKVLRSILYASNNGMHKANPMRLVVCKTLETVSSF